jgi:hypothetical protein
VSNTEVDRYDVGDFRVQSVTGPLLALAPLVGFKSYRGGISRFDVASDIGNRAAEDLFSSLGTVREASEASLAALFGPP